ncbi:MFS transporter [Lentisalinibacter orientalis]|uniref:MFS transporter n=1 Tax=Lentisalinibacter orientalis TaxID=2992241 RepID=UPI003869C642
MSKKNMLDTRRGRLTTFGILYICEGIPLGFAAVAIATYMRRAGVDVAQVGAFVASFYLPWAFKWAWAPVVDLVTLNRFGGRKAWIVLCQVLMIVTLYFVAQLDYTQHFDLLITMVIVHNVFAATCDVAIDSLAVSSLREDERAQGNGFMFAGAYIGQGLGGGGAMFVAGLYGFDVSFLYVALLLCLVLTFVVFFVRDPAAGTAAAARLHGVWQAFRDSVTGFARELGIGLFRSGKGPLIGVAFALTPIGAMALSGAASTALQVDLGMSDSQIGTLNIYAMITSGAGCVAGGWLADRLGKRRMLALFYALTTLPTLWLAVALGGGTGVEGVTINQYFAVAIAFYLCMGLHYGVGAAIFMGLTNPAVAATQFTGFMALQNLTISYSNAWQGVAVDAWGYSAMFYLDAALVAVPILLIPFLTDRQPQEAPPSPARPLPEAS